MVRSSVEERWIEYVLNFNACVSLSDWKRFVLSFFPCALNSPVTFFSWLRTQDIVNPHAEKCMQRKDFKTNKQINNNKQTNKTEKQAGSSISYENKLINRTSICTATGLDINTKEMNKSCHYFPKSKRDWINEEGFVSSVEDLMSSLV